MVSTKNERDKIVLLSKGNENLKCNGADESAHILKHGLLVDEKYQINSNLTSLNAKFSSKSWADDYHSFKFSWSSGSLIISVDEYNHIFSSPQLLHVLFNSKVNIYLQYTTSYYNLKFYFFRIIYPLVCQSVV